VISRKSRQYLLQETTLLAIQVRDMAGGTALHVEAQNTKVLMEFV
jgi:hypothetical protein